jgi:UDP-N-acetylglucosamine 1-carboxyvinyltransferase
MNIRKYFWDLKPEALDETLEIIKNPWHPKFPERMVRLLSRCDEPKEIFSIIDKKDFIQFWPRIRQKWGRTNQSPDFRAWWETIYENLLKGQIVKKSLTGTRLEEIRRIGRIIKEAREAKDWSQKELGHRVHMRQPDISAIESGKQNLTIETLIRIGRVLDINEVTISIMKNK